MYDLWDIKNNYIVFTSTDFFLALKYFNLIAKQSGENIEDYTIKKVKRAN